MCFANENAAKRACSVIGVTGFSPPRAEISSASGQFRRADI
jgi:hypothetical protein